MEDVEYLALLDSPAKQPTVSNPVESVVSSELVRNIITITNSRK